MAYMLQVRMVNYLLLLQLTQGLPGPDPGNYFFLTVLQLFDQCLMIWFMQYGI